MRRHLLLRVIGGTALLVATACARPTDDPALVAEWTHTLYGVVRTERLSPPVASRFYAYSTTAFYAGLIAGDDSATGSLERAVNALAPLPRPARGQRIDPFLTAIAAQRVVLDTVLAQALPTTRSAVARFADSVASARARHASATVRTNSDSLGAEIGLAVVAWARGDGFRATRGRPYRPPTGRGVWVNDNPGTTYTAQNLSAASQMITLDNPANLQRPENTSDRNLILSRPKAGGTDLPAVNMSGVTEPYWGELRPFVLERWDACPAPPYPAFSLAPDSPAMAEARVVRDASSNATPEQRAIALFWADNAGESGTPGGHWLSIATQMAGERKLTAVAAARLAMMTSIAVADAFIASWGYKFATNRIRPRTMIRMSLDRTWEPLIPTPPFPEYPSGHSTVSAAAAGILASVLGDQPFSDSTSVPLGHPVRTFASFTAAAHEAGISRIYGGIHFDSGNLGGRTLGECIAKAVMARFGAAAN